MKTTRPTAERLLSQFDNLHLLIEEKEKKISGVMVEALTSLQKKILSILELPEEIYDLSFKGRKKRIRHSKMSETQVIPRLPDLIRQQTLNHG